MYPKSLRDISVVSFACHSFIANKRFSLVSRLIIDHASVPFSMKIQLDFHFAAFFRDQTGNDDDEQK